MNTKIKKSLLIGKGLSSKTLSKLDESQIDSLYKMIAKEAVTKTVTNVTYDPSNAEDQKLLAKMGVHIDPNTKKLTMNQSGGSITTEENLDEDLEDPMDFEKGSRSQDPHQVGPSSDDGFGNYDDGTGEFNEMKKNKNNPYAICTSTLGKEFGTTKRSEWTRAQMKKYERCKADIDESLNEGKKSVSLFLENEITRLVEKHLPPKITKKDLMNYLSEAPAVAPAKPQTKPDVKPGTRPSHPGKNPFPGEHPAPKASRPSPERAKEEVINTILDLIKYN